ncbi:21280_t:CDS:2, partial [Gigaspora margarita]
MSKEIKDDLKDMPPTTPETHIQKIHKRITELNNKMARNPQLMDLSIVYKMQTSQEATNIVRNLASPASSNRSEILQFIRDQFEASYQDEQIDIEAIEASQMTFYQLFNYKAPGSDGLIYEFCKTFCDGVSPILKNVFNNALSL